MAVLASNMPLATPDALFSCPRPGCGNPLSPNNLISDGITVSGLVAGLCKRCEHQYTFTPGSPSTTLNGAHAQGLTALTVASGTGFSTVGAWVLIDSSSVDGGWELVQVSAAGSSTSIPVASTPLRLAHSNGATVNQCTIADLQPHSGYLSGG